MDRCPVCRAHLEADICRRCGSDFRLVRESRRQAEALAAQALAALREGRPWIAAEKARQAQRLDGAFALAGWIERLADRWEDCTAPSGAVAALARGLHRTARKVRRYLGADLATAVYRSALTLELASGQMPFRADVVVEAAYQGGRFLTPYRIDWVLDDKLAVKVADGDNLPVCCRELRAIVRLTGLEAGVWLCFDGGEVRYGWVLPETTEEES